VQKLWRTISQFEPAANPACLSLLGQVSVSLIDREDAGLEHFRPQFEMHRRSRRPCSISRKYDMMNLAGIGRRQSPAGVRVRIKMNTRLANLAPPDVFDLIFVIAAVAFNLLIVGIYNNTKKERPELRRIFGLVLLSLALPLGIVFIHYLLTGRAWWIVVSFGFVLFYLLAEWLLDYRLKIDFRQKPITHVSYIVLEYIALFSLIEIAFSIDQTWGYVVSISFWAVMASPIYLYWAAIRKRSDRPTVRSMQRRGTAC
jgi:hypothetical protein